MPSKERAIDLRIQADRFIPQWEWQALNAYLQPLTSIKALPWVEQYLLLQAVEKNKKKREKLASASSLSTEKQQKLFEAESQINQAVQILTETNWRLVFAVAVRYADQGVPVSDLMQEGMVGLIQSIHRYNETNHTRLSTLAVWWIRKYVAAAIDYQGRIIPQPQTTLGPYKKIDETYSTLTQQLQRQPTDPELLGAMQKAVGRKLTLSQVQHYLQILEGGVALEDFHPTSEDTGSHWEDYIHPKSFIPFPYRPTENLALGHVYREQLLDQVNDLPTRHSEVLTNYFGLGGRPGLNGVELGKKMGIQKQRVHQLKSEGYQFLHDVLCEMVDFNWKDGVEDPDFGLEWV